MLILNSKLVNRLGSFKCVTRYSGGRTNSRYFNCHSTSSSSTFSSSAPLLSLRSSTKFFKNPNSLLNSTKYVNRNSLITKRFIETNAESVGGKNAKTRIKLNKAEVKRLLLLAKDEKWVILAGIGCLVISSSITMAVPYALGKILDGIYKTEEELAIAKEKLKTFCLGLCAIFIIGGFANFGRVYLFNSASLRIVKDLRSRLFNRMLNQESSWFDTKGTGELINRLSHDTFQVGNSLSQNLSDGMRSTVMILAGAGMMIYTSPELALVGMAVVPCVAGMAIVYGRYVRNISKELTDKFASIMKNGEERLGNVKTVKMFCKENQEGLHFTNMLIDALSLGYKDAKARATFYGLTGLSGNIIIVSVLYYGGNLVANGQLTLGALTSFIMYAGYTAISLSGISNFYTQLNKGVGSATRIFEIFDRKYDIPLEEGIYPKTSPRGEIIFEDIGFLYPSRPNNKILNNLSMTINPGTITAVVGKSGSGKTTIAILLLRLYDPQKGRILLDGMDLKTISPVWLRRHIGAVNQEPVLFSGTIRENILYGLNPGDKISEDNFNKVCREAHVDEFVDKLPHKLDTIVGQRGMMLSGGQKQRVAIARALIKNPSILILDEATSALDAVSEELVQNALDTLMKDRTCLTIAHRLSTIRNAHNIVVLENGAIAEQGSYEDLIRMDNGTFRDLVKLQTIGQMASSSVGKESL